MPLISIIMPCFNGETFVGASLESIRRQAFQDWECVIIDDGSTDGTRSVIEPIIAADARFRYFFQENSGVAAARNAGIGLIDAGARYVSFMDHDDLLAPEALSALFQAAEAAPECIGAQCVADAIDAQDRPIADGAHADGIRRRCGIENGKIVAWEPSRPTSFNVMIYQSFCPPAIFLIRRDVLMKTGRFDSAFAMTDDWDMQIRLSRHGAFAFLDKVLVYYRRHNVNNDPAKSRVIHRSLRRVRRQAFFSTENTPDQKRIARQAYRARQSHKLHENLRGVLGQAKRGHYLKAAKCAVRAAGHLAFYMMGFPTVLG